MKYPNHLFRTLPVHRVVFKDPTRHKSKSLRTYLPRASPRDRCAFVANWVATNRRTWENGGFDPVPRDDIVDDDTIDDSEDDESLVLQKYLQLETSPPFPMQNATESLLGPQDQRRRKSIFRLFRSG